jgi:putative nucleotidyltransferase with HDIG domain
MVANEVNDSTRLLLEAATAFDSQLEFVQYTEDGICDIVDADPVGDPLTHFLVQAIRRCSVEELLSGIPKLAPFPLVAIELLQMMSAEAPHHKKLIKLAESDQVFAATVLKTANSSFFSPKHVIKSVAHAISYIGLEQSCAVLLAAALKPFICASEGRTLWEHSLECGYICEKLAATVGMDAREAFVLGLLHDIGRLLMTVAPEPVRVVQARLRCHGCPLSISEVLSCGLTHAEAGARVLHFWGLPEEYQEAIEFHHEPDRSQSKLSALLYVAEFWCGNEEDLPSRRRLTISLRRLGLEENELESLLFLRFTHDGLS